MNLQIFEYWLDEESTHSAHSNNLELPKTQKPPWSI